MLIPFCPFYFRSKVPYIDRVFVESGCYHSGQLFTAVHSEISQAQVRPAELFKTDKLTSVQNTPGR